MKTCYTIGRTTSYDEALLYPQGVHKLGAYEPTSEEPEGYKGGWVFKTIQEALELKKTIHKFDWNPEEFSVYELKLPNNWEQDVSKDPDEDGVHHLLVDALIVRKVQR